jgi:hypothetical protein
MARIAQRVKACRALQLADCFEPTVRIKQCLPKNLTLEKTIACLRTNDTEDAQFICANYDRLPDDLRNVIDIDDILAAAHCKDVYKILYLITDTYNRVRGMEAQLIAADESPGIMKSRTRYAKERAGHSDAKLVLQTTGVSPVPQNQKNVFIGKTIIDNSNNTQVNVDRHDTVVNEVSDIFAKLPSVSSEKDRGEESGH